MIKMNNIVFNASDIASICNFHPFKKVHDTFTKILSKLTDRTIETDADRLTSIIDKIDDSKTICNLISDATTSRDLSAVNSKVNQIDSILPEAIQPKVVELITLLDNIIVNESPENVEKSMLAIKDLSSKVNIAEVTATVAVINKLPLSNNIDILKKAAKQIKESIPTNKTITITDRQNIIKSIESQMNCGFGTIQEDNAIKLYETETGAAVRSNNDKCYIRRVAWLNNCSISIVGKVDGIKDDGTVIEVKNRMRKFFNPLPRYDIIQLQAYLFLLNKPTGELVEYLKNSKSSIKATKIAFDDDMWYNVLTPKIISFANLLLKVVNNRDLYSRYTNGINSVKQHFVESSL